MKTLTIEEVEQVGGAGFCAGLLVTMSVGVGALIGAGAGVGVASGPGALLGAEAGAAVGGLAASAIC